MDQVPKRPGRPTPRADRAALAREVEQLRAEIARLNAAADKRVRASEEPFRSVVESMSEGLMLFDAAGDLIYQNPASLRIHGFDPAGSGRIQHDALPATWDAWDDTGRPITFDEWPVSRVFRRERFQDQVLHVRRVETGTEFYASYNGCPIFDAAGALVLGFITIRDITAQVRATQRLEELSRTAESHLGQLLAVVDSMTEGVIISDLAGHVLTMNPEALRLHGLASADESRRKLEEFADSFELRDLAGTVVPVRDWPLGRVLRGEQLSDVEVEVRNLRTGESAYRTYAGRPVRDRDGNPILAVLTVRDVTLQKRAEEALRLSEERFRQFAETIPQLAFIADAAGQITYNNGRFFEYFGIDPRATERDGWKRLNLHHPDDLARTVAAWTEGVRGGAPFTIEYRLRRHDGQYRWHVTHVAPVRDGAGAVVMWAGTSTDVNDQREAVRAMEDANRRLQDADRRKNEFLGMLSHELRNPLAPIWNSLYVMEHSDASGERARHARQVITRQVGALARLVDDLLDVTRIVRNKIELRTADLDLAALLHRICGDYRTIMEERRIALACPAAAPVWVRGDEARLSQAIGNLLQNAAKFTPPGGRVELALEQDGAEAVVRVRDTGCGIEPELLAEIFQPFTQARQTLARSEGGLGLGLALVKGLVELHGGTVGAASAGPGTGAEFTLRLPLLPRAAAASDVRRPEAPPTPRRRVLVVDDNVDAAESLAEIVELLGHEAEIAFDGGEALRRIEERAPDTILCDLGLPGLSGYDVARAVRAAGHRIRMIAVSGYAQPDDLRRSAEAGFDAHVAKPADPERIRDLVG